MLNASSAFARPHTPAAQCLHLIRLNSVITRSELVTATGLSQPTITRAIAALVSAGYVVERNDLTRSQGRGRPTIPLELADAPWVMAGIAVGTKETYISLFDIRGRSVRDSFIETPVAELSESDFIEHIMAGLHRLRTGLERPLLSVGVTTSGHVSYDGVVSAPNLGWNRVDVAARLRYQFSVPVCVASAVPAILGSEIQSAELLPNHSVMVLFADDSIGAARTSAIGVHQVSELPAANSSLLGIKDAPPETTLITNYILDIVNQQHNGAQARTLAHAVSVAKKNDNVRALLDARAQALGDVTAELVARHDISTVVVAGSAFVDDPQAPKVFASTVREKIAQTAASTPELRMIPTHDEIVRAIARASAMDQLLRDPIALAKHATAVG